MLRKSILTALLGFSTLIVIGILCAPLPYKMLDKERSSVLLSESGELLGANLTADEQWRFPHSDSIPRKYRISTMLFEDEYFEYHPGINPVSVGRAIIQNYRAGKTVSGGSTLTMQVARMSYGNKRRTHWQKLIEIFSAIKLELFFSKREIFNMYADNAPFGGNIVGVQAASWLYFGRAPNVLSWSEAALLAVLPNNPSSLYPGRQNDALKAKRDRLLHKLHNKGHLSKSDLALCLAENISISTLPVPREAPHLLQRINREKGKGHLVKSTIDRNLQIKAKQLVDDHSFSMKANGVNNAAAIIIEVKTGNVKAYIGNSQSDGNNGQYVDIIQARRSPGSLLKPFLYALAIDEGEIAPKELLPDIPVFLSGFAPKNFDKEYRGAVHANAALTSSLNIPFVSLLQSYSYEKFHSKLQQLGFESIDRSPDHYGLSLILGGAETTLWELTAAYAGMARTVNNYPKRPYRHGYSPEDFRANRYELNDQDSTESMNRFGVITVDAIHETLEVLQELERPFEESGWRNFQSANRISWKTGTSFGFRDAWAIGISNQYVIGVWVGNADGEGRPNLTGVTAAAPLLFQLNELVDGYTDWGPSFGVNITYCSKSGMRATELCKETEVISLIKNRRGSRPCHFHKRVFLSHNGREQVNTSCADINDISIESRFILPPNQAKYFKKFSNEYSDPPPFRPGCIGDEQGMRMIYPTQYTRVKIPLEQDGKKGRLVFEASHSDPDQQVFWHLDDTFIGVTSSDHKISINTNPGNHEVVITDEHGNIVSQRFEVLK